MTHYFRIWLFVCVTIALASCAQTKRPSLSGLPPYCSRGGPQCPINSAMTASEIDLRTNGSSVRVDCERRVERKVDDAYKADCKAKIEALATSLSHRLNLVPIDTNAVQYDWAAWDCLDGIDVSFCRFFGVATVPLNWR